MGLETQAQDSATKNRAAGNRVPQAHSPCMRLPMHAPHAGSASLFRFLSCVANGSEIQFTSVSENEIALIFEFREIFRCCMPS